MSALAPPQMTCPRCRAALPAAWTWRLCPGCLLRSGLGFNDEPGGGATLPEEPAGAVFPQVFGRYELLGELGRGGQGRVFRAHDPDLGRVVALKLLRGGGLADPEERARFEAEARVMAAVRHPNLVAVHEVGVAEGQPYYAMEFIAGRDLGEIAAAGPVAPRQAAMWVQAAAAAVQAAHGHGVLHRDLKPSNVIVDEAGVPHVTDFGLAKRLDETPALTLTLSHQALGSPHYLPPEQAGARRGAAGPAADVYGLGAILYHLLTGRPPFEGGSPAEVLRLVLDVDVLPPRRLRPVVPADLETICLKALRKEPAARYATAAEFAADLGRWLAGEPVRARPVGPAERVWLWCRRRPALAAALAACGLLLLTLAVGGPLAALSIQRSRVAAERAEAGRREQLRAALLAKADALRLTGRPGQREAALAAVREAVRLRPGPDARREAVAALALPDLRAWRRLDARGAVMAFDADLRRYVTNDAAGNLHVRAVADDRPLHFLPAHRLPDGSPARLAQFGFSPEGDELGVSHVHGDLVVWQLAAQPDYAAALAAGGAALDRPVPARPRVLRLPHGARDGAVVPGTRWFASDAADGVVRFYDRDTLREAHRLAGPLRLAAVKFSPAGGRFAELAGSTVRIRDLFSGEVLRAWSLGLPAEGHVWHPDGVQLVTWSLGRSVQVWNADTGAPAGTLTGHEAAVVGAAFDARGRWLVTQSWDNDTILWCAVRQQPALRLAGAGNGLRFSADGRRVAYQAWEDDAWRIGELSEVAAFSRREMPPAAATPAGGRDLWNVTFLDSGLLVGAGTDGFGVWRLEGPSFARFVTSPDLRRPAALPGGRLLVTSDTLPQAWPLRWDVAGPGVLDGEAAPLPPLPEPVRDQAASADGGRIAVTGRTSGALHVLDGPGASAWQTLAPAGLERVTLDAVGRLLAASLEAGGAALWDATTGARRLEFAAERCDVLQLSPDGRWLVAGTAGRFIVWDTADGRSVHEHARRTVNHPVAAWSADGRLLLVHDTDGVVRLLAAGTWAEVAELPAPPLVRMPAFSPDGRWLAVPGEKSGVDLWNLAVLQAQLAELGLGW